MILKIYKDIYRLELGYGFDLVERSYLKLLWNVVKCFCDNDEMTLFGYTEYDKDLDPDKEWSCNEFLKDFHTDRLYNDPDRIITPIKDILYKHYSDLTNNKKINKNKDELLLEFRNTSLENIDPLLKNKIKAFLYSKVFVTELTDENEKFQEFVKEKISFISREWYFPAEYSLHFEEPDNFIRTLWINLKGKEEVSKWVNGSSGFTCIISEKEKPLLEYNYYLIYGEIGPDATMGLEIVERKKGHFLNTVFPRLEKIFNNQIEIVNCVG